MRTLSATLLAAQKKTGRLPYIEAEIRDFERGIKRLTWTRLYEGSEPDNHHGIAFDGQGSMHRIRSGGSGTLLYQKITSPSPSSDFSGWTQVAADCAGPCSIAACGAKVYIFYKKTDDTLRKYYSHNYGQDWTNAELAAYAGVVSLAACWWATGDVVVCLALKGGIPGKLNGIVLNTSNQSTSQHEWSDGNHPLLETYGIGATYNAALQQCEIVIAAKESDSPYNHYDLFRTRLSNTYNFLALESFLMAPVGEQVTYEYPDCHCPLTPEPYETTRIVAAEKYTGTTAYTRPVTCHSVKGTYWSDTTFTEPRPLSPDPCPYGLRLTTDTSYWWLSMPSGVWRAPRAAGDPLIITTDQASGRILSLSLNQSLLHLQSPLVLTLDNSKGQYSPLNLPNKLNKRHELVLRLGYKTTAGEETSEAGTYWIDAWQYSTSLNESLLCLYCIDGWGLMARWSAHYQMRWNKDDVNPKSVWQILYQLLARAGIKLTNTPAKPQSTAVNNFYPDFVLDPGAGGDAAIRRLLSFVPDKLVFRGQEAFTKNPLSNEDSCYPYGTDHLILVGHYSHQVTLSRSRALGRDDQDARIVEEALDWDLLSLAVDELRQDYDPNLDSAARAQERADAILRTQQTQRTQGTIVVPTNCGQELLDVVEVTDARCGIAQENHRAQAIQTDFDRRQRICTQRLVLYAP